MDNQSPLDQTENLLIHIQWSGPHTWKEVLEFHGPTHHGLYQIYGGHPTYGSGALLYIGRAIMQNFAQRVGEQHGEFTLNQDAGRVEFYIGRMIGPLPSDDAEWNRRIELAERLLIYVHRPAWNAQMELNSLEKDLRNVHVLNWRCHRSLMAEVSGARWTNKYDACSMTSFSAPKKFRRRQGVPRQRG